MLRPILAFSTLCLAAFLLAPTVASVHDKVTELHIVRETPWELFRWTDEPEPRVPLPNCGGKPQHLYSEVTEWPARIQKDQPFSLRGVVQNDDEGRIGVGSIEVDLFLNETKSEPGIHLGTVESDVTGTFTLTTSLPFELQASRYHLVAHAKEKRMGCEHYLEHWSDPETDVISDTKIEWDTPDRLVVGRNTTFTGRLVDVVGAPVRNATVNVTIDGKPLKLVTDEAGAFTFTHTPPKAGDLKLNASFKGTKYYTPSAGPTTLKVAEELFLMDGGDALVFTRSELMTVSGELYVADAVRKDTFTLDFDGVEVATCDTCEPTSRIELPLTDGLFSVDLLVPSSVEPGAYRWSASGGGLKRTYEGNLSVDVQPVLAFEAKHAGLFTREYDGSVLLTDEAGRPLQAPVAVSGPDGWHENSTDAEGSFLFSAEAPSCGPHDMVAHYNGSDGFRPATASATPRICGFLAFIPPWLLAVPWWVWPLAAALAFGAWQAYRGWRQRYATTILGGPPITLAFTEPRDDAAGYSAIGESVVVTAFLEEPLPDGHKLRMGSPRGLAEAPIDAELRAHLHLVPDKLGDLPLRAEIVDGKGRVVTRRTITLHVVKYAEEIEKRYLRLRAAHGAGEEVTPREFERWLHERAPGLDPDVARRLVRLFEEADYSPRVAGRAEFAAYLAAEGGVQEVSPPVAA